WAGGRGGRRGGGLGGDQLWGVGRGVGGRGAPTAIARLGVRRCRPARQRRSRRRCAQAALDRVEPKQRATPPAARRPLRPDAENFGGGGSFLTPPLASHHSSTSSARASQVGGVSGASALAAVRLWMR